MTQKIYKTARGKTVDLGSLILQNENTRAVGNMNVNARGDILDSSNQVIEPKNRQVQKQYKKQTNVSQDPVVASLQALKQKKSDEVLKNTTSKPTTKDIFDESPVPTVQVEIKEPEVNSPPMGGLAAAIARSRIVKQELEKAPNKSQPNKITKL